MTVSTQAADTPLVDAHFHLYTRDMPLTPWAWHHPPEDATAEQFIALMDQHGIGYGVIAAASLHGQYNDYVIRSMRRNPRLRGTAFVLPETDMYTLERMKADGIVGIRLFFRRVPNPPDLRSPEYRLLLRRVRDLDWHVHTLASGAALPEVINAMEDAGVKLVIDHFGKPDERLGIDCPGFKALLAAVERGRTWVKLSGGFRMPSPEAARNYARALLRVSGGERLVWGSDWPFAAFENQVSYAQTIADLHDWVPDAATRRLITGDTPMRLYFGA
ncbi:amidohydrolase family protein [Roseomonas marmotae]|uniref:Amidohydrolase family protein n=1 Tax=Roseomonas marmotae TaxID=2768161 RepID=A0ABS3KDW2_9PROT|nr:amidohydrolase family protein [Roseomonas marmotae]MBO1074526.1 amidohydrolase family protein [Roseomonas marmotae]QTI81560.1 amidohydrolase family protein [Roseomonas marmotae]